MIIFRVILKVKYLFLLIIFNKNIFGIERRIEINNNNRNNLYNIVNNNVDFDDYLELVVNERNNENLDNNININRHNILDFFTICNIDPDRICIYIKTTFNCFLCFCLMYNFYKIVFNNNNNVILDTKKY